MEKKIRDKHNKNITVQEYLYRLDKLRYTTFVIKPSGLGYYLYDGKEVLPSEFKRMFPLPISLVMLQADNYDGRKDWLRS